MGRGQREVGWKEDRIGVGSRNSAEEGDGLCGRTTWGRRVVWAEGTRRTSVGEEGGGGLAQAERRWKSGVGGREVSRCGQQERNAPVWVEGGEGW